MIFAIPVNPDGSIGHSWGKAPRLALATMDEAGSISDWTEHDVAWDVAHGEGGGAHHARVARFLIDHHVTGVIADHMGEGMSRMLDTMGLSVILEADGDARAAADAAASD